MFNKFLINRFLAAALLAAAFLAPASIISPSVAEAATPFRYGVWLPFWRSQDGATDIAPNLDHLYEVSPFSYEMRWDGSLVDSLKIGGGTWDPWFGAVRDAGVKIVPTIAWFDTAGIYNLLSRTRSRQWTEDNILQLAQENGFDGIDIDFEAMSPATRPFYSLFIKGLAIRLHPEHKMLTCTVQSRTPLAELYATPPASVTYPENYAVLNQYCDEVRIMAYDQQTIDLALNAQKGNGTLYSPVADTDWVKSVIKETLKYLSPKKVMLGIPTYGYEYQVSWTGGVTTYERVRAFDFMAAMDRADTLGIQPVRNNAGELSFTFASSTHLHRPPILVASIASSIQPLELATTTPDATTTFYVSFPDSQSILDKINLAKKFGLRGAMLFKADGDIDPMTWEYMK